MSKELSPAFQFYPRDWLSDPNVCLLSYEQEGWYIHLICHCWMEGHIPADAHQVGRILGFRDHDIAGLEECQLLDRFNKRQDDIRELLDLCFVPEAQLENGEAQLQAQLQYLVHPRVERERKAQLERRKERSNSGRRGGKASVITRLKNPSSAWKQLQANTQANSSSSSSSSSSINTPIVPRSNNGTSLQDRFISFWAAYPRRESRVIAWKAFQKLKPDDKTMTLILDWLPKAIASDQWQDRSLIPYPQKFLNERRWEGDPPPTAKQPERIHYDYDESRPK